MLQGFPEIGEYKVLVECITYNHAQFIEDTLCGFAMQQTSFPYICCVYDDASQDGEQEVLRQWVKDHCNKEDVKTYDHPLTIILMAPDKNNPNCIYAIHLQKVNTWGKPEKEVMMQHWKNQCEYVALCEGDDYWIDPLKLQKQVDYMEANQDYSLCFHNAFYLMYESRKASLFVKNYCTDTDISVVDAISKWSAPTASLFYRSELFLEYPCELARIYSGDYSLFLILFSRGKVRYIDKAMSVYRRTEQGVTSTVDMIFAYSEHIRFLKSYDLFTKCKYNSIIRERIRFLEDLINYIDIRNNHKYHKLFLIIPFLLRKFISKQ